MIPQYKYYSAFNGTDGGTKDNFIFVWLMLNSYTTTIGTDIRPDSGSYPVPAGYSRISGTALIMITERDRQKLAII